MIVWRGRVYCGRECAGRAGAGPEVVEGDPPPSTVHCAMCGREMLGVWVRLAAEAVREAIRAVREAALWDPKVSELSADEIWAALEVPPPDRWLDW